MVESRRVPLYVAIYANDYGFMICHAFVVKKIAFNAPFLTVINNNMLNISFKYRFTFFTIMKAMKIKIISR